MEDTIAGKILNYGDEKFEEALEEEGFKSYVKAFWAGACKGFVDGCFIGGAVLCVDGLWIIAKAIAKRNK